MKLKNKSNLYLIIITFILLTIIFTLYYYNKYIYAKEGWGKVGRSISRGVSSAARAAADAARRAADAARRAAEAAARALRELQNWYNKLINAMRNLPGEISKGFNEYGRLTNDIRNLADKVFSEVRKIEDLLRFPAKFFNDISKKTTDFFEMIREEVEKLVAQIRNFAVALFDNIKNDMVKEFNGIFGAILNFFERLGRMIAEFFEMIVRVLKNIFIMIFNKIKYFFEKTLVGGLKAVFNFIMSIFKFIGGIIRKIFEFLLAIPGCVPYWIKDLIKKSIDDILPGWLKTFNNNVTWPVFMFFFNIFRTICEFFGFNFDISFDNKKCYPKFPFMTDFVNVIKDLFYLIANFLTGKKLKRKRNKSKARSSQAKEQNLSKTLLGGIEGELDTSKLDNVQIPGISIPTF